MEGEDRGDESSSTQSWIPLRLIPVTDLPVCVDEGLGLWAGLVVFPGYFYEDVRPMILLEKRYEHMFQDSKAISQLSVKDAENFGLSFRWKKEALWCILSHLLLSSHLDWLIPELCTNGMGGEVFIPQHHTNSGFLMRLQEYHYQDGHR